MLKLVVRSGRNAGKQVSLPMGEVYFGREEGVHLRIPSTDVSRRHCLLVVDATCVTIRDLGSRNGTFVNGSPVNGEQMLVAGDLLQVGPMAFELADSKTSPPKPKRAPKADEPASADEIANWLDESAKPGLPPGDTTIVSVTDTHTDSGETASTLAPRKAPVRLGGNSSVLRSRSSLGLKRKSTASGQAANPQADRISKLHPRGLEPKDSGTGQGAALDSAAEAIRRYWQSRKEA